MAFVSDPEDGYSLLQPSSSKMKMINGKNPLADFAFDKLPTELLVEIFHRARAHSVSDACEEKYPYPVALAQVCRHWRNVALGAPTLWTDIRIMQYDAKETRRAPHIYLERSKTCPIFLTWFLNPDQSHPNIQEITNDLLIPGSERWQRITIIAESDAAVDGLLTTMESLDFPFLQDIEISYMFVELSPSKPSFCRNAPFLRRCRFRGVPSFPPLPSNLVVLDCMYPMSSSGEFDLNPLLEFLPHVAHSLEHLRFGPPFASEVQFTPRASKIPLEHLKSLIIRGSHVIMDHVFTPNLTHLVVLHLLEAGARNVAKMFEGFSAPVLQSIQFHEVSLLPILNAHNLPSMFSQLESVTLSGCTDEAAVALLLEPPKPKKPLSLQKASEYPSKHRGVKNPFPNLKELTISDMAIWTSLQAAIDKRLKNGDNCLRKIRFPKEATETIMLHLRQWLPAQGIEPVPYESGKLPTSTPEFQDDFCDEETRLFLEIIEQSELGRYDEEDDDYEYWEEGFCPEYDEYEDGDEGDMFCLDYEEDEEGDEEEYFYEG